MFSRIVATLAAVLILPAAAQASSTWYVAKGGNNANTCADAAHPCLTIGGAVTKSASGDTIDIGPGKFSEAVNAGGKVLTFNGAGPDASTGTTVDGHGVGSPFLMTNGGQLHDIRATEDSSATIVAGSTGSSHELIITNAVILADGFQSPVDAEGSPGSLFVSITDSTLQQVSTTPGGSPEGLELTGATDASLTRTTVSSNTATGVSGYSGVNISATDSTITGTTGVADTNGILHLYRCRVTATEDNGIWVFASNSAGGDATTIVEDSLVKGVTAAAVGQANYTGKSSAMTLHDSTLVASGPGSVDGVFAAASVAGTTSSITLDGSAVQAQSTDGGSTRDIDANGAGASVSASFSAFSTAVPTSGATVPTPGSGSNISGDPQFAGDYTLQQSSPLIDKGDQASVGATEKDLTGGARVLDGNGDGTATVDIGAFEHTYVAPPPSGGGGGGGATTTPPPSGTTDTTAPAFTNVKVRNGKLRFTLSEAAKVTVTITKGRKHKRVRRFTITGKAGANSARFKKLKPGTYRITLRATDGAGNRSKAFGRAFSVKRR